MSVYSGIYLLSSTDRTEGDHLYVDGQSDSELQASQGYVVRSCLKTNDNPYCLEVKNKGRYLTNSNHS